MTTAFACKTLDDFLSEWGPELGIEADASMAPLHVPSRDAIDWLLPLHRKPYPGQSHCIAAAVKALARQNNIGLICEPGSGKTLLAAAICHNHANTPQPKRWHKKNPAAAPKSSLAADAAYRVLVLCPGHLQKKWKREIERTVPGADVAIISTFSEVVALTNAGPPKGPEWFIISKDRAKLSCGWEAAVIDRQRFGREGLRCPACDEIQFDNRRTVATAEYMARERRVCQKCGERLWQDVPQPRRYSPALFIKKHLHRFFDYLIVDESHDMKGADTVQADAMGFLSSAAKKTLTLTGTLVGGYAWHVRTTLFRVGAARSLVEQNLGWKDEQAFNERYGRIETTVISTGAVDGQGHRRARGGSKRRVIKRTKPGIMPTLFGDHLITTNIFLSLDEVCADLPSFRETLIPVEIDKDILTEYQRVEAALRDAIKAMMHKPGGRSLLGKLLHTLLAYPDFPFTWDEIGYHEIDPKTEEEEWVGVVTPKNFEPERIYAKELALIEQIKAELAEGRKCWVFTTMVNTRDAIGRLEGLLRAEGITAKVLRSSVEPIAREEWIEREGPRCDVILSMPELVKTGLDFFDHYGRYNFPSIMFYMTGYNSFTLSQAGRRAWRIGQTKPCRTYYFFAKNTMQEVAMELMAKKMQATSAVSGRFSTEGLAAMAGDDDSMEMAMAKALVDKTSSTGGALRAWDKIIGTAAAEHGAVTPDMIDAIVAKAAQPAAPAPPIAAPAVTEPARRVLCIDDAHTDLFALLDDLGELSELPA